jgi:hypothetical protein
MTAGTTALSALPNKKLIPALWNGLIMHLSVLRAARI